jgi:hypothetical protein
MRSIGKVREPDATGSTSFIEAARSVPPHFTLSPAGGEGNSDKDGL